MLKQIIGHTAYWVTWPLLYAYAPYRTSARILLIYNDHFVGVASYFGDSKWQLPGGGVKRGEAPLDAAIRELYEETGISLPIKLKNEAVSICDSKKFCENGINMKYTLYCINVDEQYSLHPQVNEISKAEWLSRDQQGLSKHIYFALNSSKV